MHIYIHIHNRYYVARYNTCYWTMHTAPYAVTFTPRPQVHLRLHARPMLGPVFWHWTADLGSCLELIAMQKCDWGFTYDSMAIVHSKLKYYQSQPLLERLLWRWSCLRFERCLQHIHWWLGCHHRSPCCQGRLPSSWISKRNPGYVVDLFILGASNAGYLILRGWDLSLINQDGVFHIGAERLE